MENELQTAPMTGSDISAPIDHMELDGVRYALKFDHTCYRVAEDVYELEYKRPDVNFGQILQYLAAGKLGAVMAVLYGALIAAGLNMSWPEYQAKFRILDIPNLKDALMKRVADSLPEAGKKDPR